MKNRLLLVLTICFVVLTLTSFINPSSSKVQLKKPKFVSHMLNFSMTQCGNPYLDGNLFISYEGQSLVAAATDQSGVLSITDLDGDYYNGIFSVTCPIIDQWNGSGLYRLKIYGTDMNGTSVTYLVNQTITKDATNTPDWNVFNFSFKLNDLPIASRPRVNVILTVVPEL